MSTGYGSNLARLTHKDPALLMPSLPALTSREQTQTLHLACIGSNQIPEYLRFKPIVTCHTMVAAGPCFFTRGIRGPNQRCRKWNNHSLTSRPRDSRLLKTSLAQQEITFTCCRCYRCSRSHKFSSAGTSRVATDAIAHINSLPQVHPAGRRGAGPGPVDNARRFCGL